MTKVKVAPTVCCRDSVVQLRMQPAQGDNIVGLFFGVVEAVIGLGQPFLPGKHDRLTLRGIAIADRVKVNS